MCGHKRRRRGAEESISIIEWQKNGNRGLRKGNVQFPFCILKGLERMHGATTGCPNMFCKPTKGSLVRLWGALCKIKSSIRSLSEYILLSYSFTNMLGHPVLGIPTFWLPCTRFLLSSNFYSSVLKLNKNHPN